MTKSVYLATADLMLSSVIRGARGAWPRACAWLLRHELEAAMDRYWARVAPAIGRTTVQRPKLLLLTHYAGPELGRRASYLWWALSRAGHHHPYELGVNIAELTRLRNELIDLITLLDNADPPPDASPLRTTDGPDTRSTGSAVAVAGSNAPEPSSSPGVADAASPTSTHQ
jgi:hypothetical protein